MVMETSPSGVAYPPIYLRVFIDLLVKDLNSCAISLMT